MGKCTRLPDLVDLEGTVAVSSVEDVDSEGDGEVDTGRFASLEASSMKAGFRRSMLMVSFLPRRSMTNVLSDRRTTRKGPV